MKSVLIIILVLVCVSRSSPIHPAIKQRAKNWNGQDIVNNPVSISQPSPTIQVSERPFNEKKEKEDSKGDLVSTEARYKCDYPACQYSSPLKGNFQRHRRSHTQQRPFPCDFLGCTFAANYKSNLDVHKRSHTGEKPYHCDHPGCEFAARRREHLKQHMMTHNEEWPFACNDPGCQFAARQKSNLKKHMRFHNKPENLL